MDCETALIGAALGSAVGDSLGLPREGLSPSKARHLYGERIEHRFFFGRGVVSDDTEHTMLVLQSLALHGTQVDDFGRDLARRLRWWLVGLPPGIGFGTLRALTKSWLGFGPQSSGVRSAGNGPAMRSAVIGVFSAAKGIEPDALVEASTLITHRDQRALEGALAVAKCARLAVAAETVLPADGIAVLVDTCRHEAWAPMLEHMAEMLSHSASTSDFACRVGLTNGVSGYIVHSVPVAVYAWLRHPEDAERAISEVISAGGDSDSTAAVTGALVGCRVGEDGLPLRWRSGIADWPVNVPSLRSAAQAALSGSRPPRTSLAHMLFRNLVTMPIVVAHAVGHWRFW